MSLAVGCTCVHMHMHVHVHGSIISLARGRAEVPWIDATCRQLTAGRAERPADLCGFNSRWGAQSCSPAPRVI